MEDHEEILYILLDPDYWTNGCLTKAAFSKSKLLEKRLSVARKSYSDEAEITRKVVQPHIRRRPERRLVGVLVAQCKQVRQILMEDSAERAVCVIDDGQRDYQAHAHLGFSDHRPTYWTKNRQQAVRASLVEVFSSQPRALEAVFGTV